MDAAIKQLLGEKEPDTLPCSYRSRPALVSHTSELFVRGFADQSISEHRVRLEAAKSTQPRGLGPHLECWTLNRKDQDPDAAAVAAGVIELLNDPSVKVRDQDTNRSRRVEPKDIAVLSRRNDISAKVATALKDRGVRTVRSQAGLAATLEGQVVMAGLELWVDPDDALAAAKFARLISYPEDEDRFISRVLKCPGYEAFSGLDEVETLRRARQARRVLRVLRALRALWVLRALRVRRVLRALWAALVPELAQARPLPRATLAPPLPVRWPGTSSETVCTAFWPLTGPTSAQRNASSLRSACCKGGRWKATSLPKA